MILPTPEILFFFKWAIADKHSEMHKECTKQEMV